MKPELSILFSTYNRLHLFRRTLWALVNRPPSVPFEVIVADDGSQDDILGELRLYSAQFPWKFIRVSSDQFEKETGVRKFFNNPALTYNVAFRHASADLIVQHGQEVLPVGPCYDQLLKAVADVDSPNFLALSTVLDVPEHVLIHLDRYGTNLSPEQVRHCHQWPLATPNFHTDVTNYISLCSRSLYEAVGGYDERYLRGIGKEDSDFVRRCRALPGWTDESCMRRSLALALHQSHKGRTWWGNQDQSIVTDVRWKEGEILSKEVWDSWDGGPRSGQPWEFGTKGVLDVVTNC